MVELSGAAARFASLLEGEIVNTQPLQVKQIPLVHQILSEIGFHSVVERFCGDDGDIAAWKIFEAFVHSRVESQTTVPVSCLERWIANSILPHVLDASAEKFNEYRVGRVIEAAGNAPIGLWLEIVENAHRAYRFDLSWDIYDTSSIHFEGEYKLSDLAEYGYSRDGKPGTKQINLGLNVSGEDAIPLLYHLFPGSTEDSTTVIPNMEQMKALYKRLGAAAGPEILGDRAMLSVPLVHRYLKEGIDFIGSIKACKLIDEVIAGVPHELLLQHSLDYVAQRHQNLPEERREQERYYAVRTVVTIPPHKEVAGSKHVTVGCLVVLASGKSRLDAQLRETLLSRTEHRLEEIKTHLNKGKYKNQVYAQDQVKKAVSKYPAIKDMIATELVGERGELALAWSRDNALIDAARRTDGKYLILFSNHERTTLDVFRRFKARDRVEKRVDDIKGPGPVVVRPIYLHKDERIRGLVLGCMIALLVVSIAEMLVKRNLRKKLTAAAMQDLFRNFSAALLTLEDHTQLVVMPVGNKWERQILDAVGVSMPVVAPVAPACAVSNLSRNPAVPPPPWEDIPPSDIPSG